MQQKSDEVEYSQIPLPVISHLISRPMTKVTTIFNFKPDPTFSFFLFCATSSPALHGPLINSHLTLPPTHIFAHFPPLLQPFDVAHFHISHASHLTCSVIAAWPLSAVNSHLVSLCQCYLSNPSLPALPLVFPLFSTPWPFTFFFI